MLVELVVSLVVGLITWSFVYHQYIYFKYKVPPHYTALPIIGHFYLPLLVGLTKQVEFSAKAHKELGKTFFTFFFGTPCINTNDPAILKQIFTSDFEVFDRSVTEQSLFKEFLGDGLILLGNGSKWKKIRERLMDAFHQAKLRSASSIITQETQRLVDRLKAHNGAVINFQDELTTLTFAAIASFTMNVDISKRPNPENFKSYCEMWDFILSHAALRQLMAPLMFFFKPPSAIKYEGALNHLKEIAREVFDQRKQLIKEAIEQNKPTPPATTLMDTMVDFHVAEPDFFTFEDVLQQAVTFLFAGHDTTSNMIAWAVYHLWADQELLGKVRAELEEVMGNATIPTFEHLSQLRLLRNVLKESLRLYPSAPLRGRTTTAEVTLANGFVVPKGWNTSFDLSSAMRLPEYWPNPEKFDPSRFEEQSSDRPSAAYAPFGGGVRRCIGETYAMNEGLIVVAAVVKNLSFEYDQSRGTPKAEITLTQRVQNGLWMSFRPL